jgi:hypothetical protein
MERSSKRGKIPQQDWPSIIKRYETGETLASIARTYDCSPPAISYIISRSRARDTAEGAEQIDIESREPRLVKGHPNDMPATEAIHQTPEIGETVMPVPAAQPSDSTESSGPQPSSIGDLRNGTAGAYDGRAETAMVEGSRPPVDRHDKEVPPAAHLENRNSQVSVGADNEQSHSGESRRTLHLSLSNKSPQGMENSPDERRRADTAEASAARPVGNQQPVLTPHLAQQNPTRYGAVNNGGEAQVVAERPKAREAGAFIDRELRQRVDGDILAFLAAFDAALADDTIESRAGLREATDRLLRAGARTRIELERLEARVPLSARDTGGYSASNWRPR